MRMLALGAATLAVAMVGGWALLQPAPQPPPGVTTPSFVGFSHSQVSCANGAATMPLRIDDEPPVVPSAERCSGRVGVLPDPRVIRQVPAAGVPLRPGVNVRLYTACHRRACL